MLQIDIRTQAVTDMLEDLNWNTLETRRSKSQVTMMFKIINGLVDIPAADLVTPALTRTRSHHGKKLRQYATSTDTLKYSFFPCTIQLWNSFPPTLAEPPTWYPSSGGCLPSHFNTVRCQLQVEPHCHRLEAFYQILTCLI